MSGRLLAEGERRDIAAELARWWPHIAAPELRTDRRGRGSLVSLATGLAVHYRLCAQYRDHKGYTDETTGQIAAALGLSYGAVARALTALDHPEWWPVIRRGGRGIGSRRAPAWAGEMFMPALEPDAEVVDLETARKSRGTARDSEPESRAEPREIHPAKSRGATPKVARRAPESRAVPRVSPSTPIENPYAGARGPARTHAREADPPRLECGCRLDGSELCAEHAEPPAFDDLEPMTNLEPDAGAAPRFWNRAHSPNPSPPPAPPAPANPATEDDPDDLYAALFPTLAAAKANPE